MEEARRLPSWDDEVKLAKALDLNDRLVSTAVHRLGPQSVVTDRHEPDPSCHT
jgi:hypothetical protein